MESSEIVREKEHPFAKEKVDNSSYFSRINISKSFLRSFRRKFIFFFTRHYNRDTR